MVYNISIKEVNTYDIMHTLIVSKGIKNTLHNPDNTLPIAAGDNSNRGLRSTHTVVGIILIFDALFDMLYKYSLLYVLI